ncbi:hypothetical protein [Variovorax sp. WS11]|uniref:hypothetical protein n=1 Tax=Variovorax sp. WS11 TaxID=1105204 RepID=UPI0011B23245|nr:hypothetical protein [Variovorax sp. WS11]
MIEGQRAPSSSYFFFLLRRLLLLEGEGKQGEGGGKRERTARRPGSLQSERLEGRVLGNLGFPVRSARMQHVMQDVHARTDGGRLSNCFDRCRTATRIKVHHHCPSHLNLSSTSRCCLEIPLNDLMIKKA